jgi:cysteinyl-tRNA synthetase
MIVDYFNETLSIYCGGIDNLYRHHDYTLAVLESIRPFPMARYWLHGHHLLVNGQKMSKSKGNIVYVDTLLSQGYSVEEIRFLLIYGHYRSDMNFSAKSMEAAARKLREFKGLVGAITKHAARNQPGNSAPIEGKMVAMLKKTFVDKMDTDLDVKGAVDGLCRIIQEPKNDQLKPTEAAEIIQTLTEIDSVLKVIFS